MNLAKKGTILLAALGAFCVTSCGPKAMNYEQALAWVEKNYKHGEDKEIVKVDYEWDCTANEKKDVIKDVPGIGDVDVNTLVDMSIMNELEIEMTKEEMNNNKGLRKNVDYSAGIWDGKSTYDKDKFAEIYGEGKEDPDIEQEFTTDGQKLIARETFTTTEGTELGDVTFVQSEIRTIDESGYTCSIELKMQQNDIKITSLLDGKTYNLGNLNSYYKITVVERGPIKPEL